MIKIVRDTISAHQMLQKGDRVIVALSGGADSVALLHVMLSLRDELELTVFAAHVNHNLRGEESDRDQAFAEKLCEEHSVELFVRSENIRELSENSGVSEELCGRNIRYDFFKELSEKYSAKVATAHTLSDSEETMLYNMARGTGLHGLCSIPYKRDYIIRPLLDVTREQIEQFVDENNLSFVQDSTNFLEEVCRRNKIRLCVLPPLKSINDGFDENFLRLRKQLISVDRYMRLTARNALREAEEKFGYNAEKLLQLDDAVLGTALNLVASDYGIRLEQKHIDIMKNILKDGGAVCLEQDKTAVCSQGILRIVSDSEESFDETPLREISEVTFRGKKYSFEETACIEEINRKFSAFAVDYDKIPNDAVIRTRREGDTFSPIKRGVTKPLRKLQGELSIPKEERDKSLLIAKGSTVLWAEHIGVSQQGVCDENTKKIILIDIRRVW